MRSICRTPVCLASFPPKSTRPLTWTSAFQDHRPTSLTTHHRTIRRRLNTQRYTGPPILPSARQHRLAQVHNSSSNHIYRTPVQASASSFLIVLAAFSAAAALFAAVYPQPPKPTSLHQGSKPEVRDGDGVEMSGITPEKLPGRSGTLTPDQEESLRKLWAAIFSVCGVSDPDESLLTFTSTPTADKTNGKEKDKDKSKKRKMGFLSRKKDKSDSDAASVNTDDAEDKYGQNKQFLDTLANTSPEKIRATLWAMVKHDHPDNLVLRFLRARKWDVEKALVMLVSTMNWRANEMRVDDDIMLKGEAGMAEQSAKGTGKEKQVASDFMTQIRTGKSFLHGLDNKGRPVCFVRVRLHHQGEQCEESIERYTVYIIETARMVLRPPVDTATIIFDMTGFSMANMDYTPVKFIIKCFEANYPESLGSVLVHKAPWLFQGVWKVIRGWLDPVVASKVHFTNNLKDLEEYIAPSRVIKELDGEEQWEYRYVEPKAGENDKMKDTATRDGLLAARERLYKDFEEATQQWIAKPADAAVKVQRENIAEKLKADYWVLDPYVRARSQYDRTGWIQGERAVPYASQHPYATQTSVDDLD